MTPRTWSDADRPCVIVTPRTLSDVIDAGNIPSIGGKTGHAATWRFLLVSKTNIYVDFFLFSVSLFLNVHVVLIWSISADRNSTFIGGLQYFIYLTEKLLNYSNDIEWWGKCHLQTHIVRCFAWRQHVEVTRIDDVWSWSNALSPDDDGWHGAGSRGFARLHSGLIKYVKNCFLIGFFGPLQRNVSICARIPAVAKTDLTM